MEDVKVSHNTLDDDDNQNAAQGQNSDMNNNNDTNNNNDATKSRRDRFNRRGLMVCSCLSTTFYVGSWFGWGPMQLLLEENGAFHWKCGPEYDTLDEICPAQSQSLLNVQLIPSVTQILSPLVGHFTDHYGAPKAAFVMAACLWAGLLLWTISSSQSPSTSWDRVLFFANSLLAINVWFGSQLTVQTGLYFAGHTKSRVIFLLNALFDAGSITYLFLWWLATQVFKLSLTAVSAGYLVCSVLVAGTGLYFWFVAVPEPDDDILIYGEESDDDDSNDNDNNNLRINASVTVLVADQLIERGDDSDSASSVKNSQDGISPPTPCSDHQILEATASTTTTTNTTPVASSSAHMVHPNNPILITPTSASQEEGSASADDTGGARRQVSFRDVDARVGESEWNPNKTASSSSLYRTEHSQQQPPTQPEMSTTATVNQYILVADRTPREQLLSGPYLLLCLFFSLHVTMNMWVLATTRDFLAYLGDNELNNRYLTIFTLLLPASILSVPFVDLIIQRLGFAGGFQSINALALGYSIIRVATSNLNVQIVGFVLFSFYRCFLFGVSFSFLPQLLQQNVVGKGYGIVCLITGILNAIQIPLARLAMEELDGNFFIPNLVFTVLVIPCIVAAWFLGHAIRRENKGKQRLRKSLGGGILVLDRDRLSATADVRTDTEP